MSLLHHLSWPRFSESVEFRLSVSEYVCVKLTDRILDNGLPEMSFTCKETINGESTTTTMLIDALLIATGRRPNVTGELVEPFNTETLVLSPTYACPSNRYGLRNSWH
jgi:hypothetical protein